MCRYAMRNYRTHWACVADRRSFKHHADANPRCPDCRGPMVNLGRDFHAPRRADLREWRKVALILDAGVTLPGSTRRLNTPPFDSCGCTGPGPRPRTLADAQSEQGRRRSDRRAPAVKARVRMRRSVVGLSR